MDLDPDPGGPKTCGSGGFRSGGFGSGTLEKNYKEDANIARGTILPSMAIVHVSHPIQFQSKILQELLVTVLTLQTAVLFDMFHERLHVWK
jgi:hypothetical protein